ncbi:MAG: PIN domain-containing protein [Candidatus Moranbacteria bacterium]|nr:PIN domain-containing protein [Candidatus Moranbacteria bacterium]
MLILISGVNSDDANHLACYSFYENNKENSIFYIPSIAYFEFQATQSRNRKKYKELYMESVRKYDITYDLIKKCDNLDLFNKFNRLRGADLVYACISKIENMPLATNDKDFKSVESDISVIWVN